ncbi:MAG: 2,3-diphosphoglycerate-dependent phosphoglycerate mutase [Actinobacteria bacterium]|nr:2,3-diphosphoglycerate-dependent phosphoglycerate mutase [Actinomycetota bacterium]MCB9389343.1 2,3-diphosphoglycerate-dependent phosphoglycerate mutase [Acidimicrobiia bacterium]
MSVLVLVRHGQSQWNLENRFTGWEDVDLTEQGEQEARQAGRDLLDANIAFDIAYTSLQKRAIRTLHLAAETMDRCWLPEVRSWRLNERHYGDLQGLNKIETTERFGKDQVFEWRRSYDTPPPPLSLDDPRHPRFDPRYQNLPPDVLPATECLADVVARVVPYFHDTIALDLCAGRNVIVAAHGNSLRALVKHLDNISDADIAELNIPTGIPLKYEFDASFNVVERGYLGDADKAAEAAAAVAAQAG